MSEICYRYGCSFPVGFVAPIVAPVIPLGPLTEKRMREMVVSHETWDKPKKKLKKRKPK